jgi:hypothetical protein
MPAQSVAPAEQQIAAAVLPLPAEMRAGARVLGYDAQRRLVELRKGGGGMTCLADDPADQRTHVACYHDALEPFMARGRALRAEGVKDAQVDTVRYREVDQGRLAMPRGPAMLYSITAPKPDAFDAAKGEITGGRRLFVAYIPGATTASTGISTVPKAGEPWLMLPGTPKAHIMFTPGM